MQQPLSKKYLKSGSTSPRPVSPSQLAPEYFGTQGLTNLFSLSRLGLPRWSLLIQQKLMTLTYNQAVLRRTSAHLIVILLAVTAISLSNIQLSWGGIRTLRPLQQAPAQAIPLVPNQETGAPLTLPAQLSDLQNGILFPAAVPRTIIPERPREIISVYKVEGGDTIYGIAAKFGLDPETIIWSNPDLEKTPDILSIDQELNILPVNGVYHQVGESDTLESIASTFKVEASAIINYGLNKLDLDNPVIVPGQWVVVPGGTKPFVPRAVTAYIYDGPIPEGASTGSGSLDWPASGTIYQGYFPWHPAVDIAGYVGAPVLAADSGFVIVAGWDNSGYGYNVVIEHGNGYQTQYAHLNAYYVDVGQSVSKGQQIGEMGITGNATGPHLHFEVRQGTVQRNPIGFLP